MRLARTIQGQGRPLVIAHGLFGSARNWGVLAKRLSDTARVIGVDMRNHGDSPWSDDNGYPALAADLAETVEEEGAPADILGHSMGGKAAMMLALMRPDLVGRLVVGEVVAGPWPPDRRGRRMSPRDQPSHGPLGWVRSLLHGAGGGQTHGGRQGRSRRLRRASLGRRA